MPKVPKVLFVTWGYSIHGERRIRVFSADPAFAVAVASPYDYGIQGTRYFPLTDVDPVVRRPVADMLAIVRARRQLAAAIVEFQPDVLFLQTLLFPSFLGLSFRKLPKVITFWNGDLLSWTYSTGMERRFKRHILRLGLRTAFGVTVNSAAARDVCLEHGAPSARVHVIRYPGIDLGAFRPMDKQAAKAALGLDGHPVILNERGPVAHKNLDIMVRAAPAILSRYPQARFLFLAPDKGTGADAFALYRELARNLGVEHAMIWRGNVPYAELPAVINAADVWVSLSTADSMPNSMLDAMACDIPVVSADLPQIREWVADGLTGRLVDPFDETQVAGAVLALLDSPADAARMAEAARRQIAGRADYDSQVNAVKELVRMAACGNCP